MPESAPQIRRGETASTRAVKKPAARELVSHSARRPATSAAASVSAMPRPLALAMGSRPSRAGMASTSVHSGAVDPATGMPGLYENPCPDATFLANCR